MAEDVAAAERKKLRTIAADALKNGFGTIITRLIIMALPFMVTGAAWVGGKAIELLAAKVEDHFDRIDKTLEKMATTIEKSGDFDRRIELKVQHNSDDIDFLKQVVEMPQQRRPNDRR